MSRVDQHNEVKTADQNCAAARAVGASPVRGAGRSAGFIRYLPADDRGFEEECPCHHEPLPLAPAELMGKLAEQLVGAQADLRYSRYAFPRNAGNRADCRSKGRDSPYRTMSVVLHARLSRAFETATACLSTPSKTATKTPASCPHPRRAAVGPESRPALRPCRS